MDSRDLRNLSEAWSSATSCEDLCEEWLQERIEERFDFSQNTIEELAEALQGSLMDKAKQDGATRAAAQGQAFKSFADRGGILGFLQRRLQGARQAVQQRGGPRGQGNRPIAGNPNRQGGAKPAPAPAPQLKGLTVGPGGFNINGKPVQTSPTAPVRPAAPVAAKPTAPSGTAPTTPSTPLADKVTPAAAPARRSLAQDLADLRAMSAASQMRQQGKKINGQIATGAGVQAASKSVSDLNKGARQYMKQDADLFDIVKGYLLDEGATEEEALKRMATMTEEERNEIIESSCGGGHSKKKKKKSGY